MSETNPGGLGGKLTEAYNRMLERVRERLHDLDEDARPALQRAIDHAEETASELGELSREEARKVANYLRRDLHDAAEFLEESSHELGDWLRFDLQLVERGLAQLFSQVADQARLELAELAMRADALGEWHTGEVTGIGTLECKSCGEKLHFHKTGHIPPCPKCNGTRYRRVSHTD